MTIGSSNNKQMVITHPVEYTQKKLLTQIIKYTMALFTVCTRAFPFIS